MASVFIGFIVHLQPFLTNNIILKQKDKYMNRLKLILLSAFAATTTNIFAQYTPYTPIKDKFDNKEVKADGWHEISLQISPVTLSATENIKGTGFSLGYNKTFNIIKDKPVYLIAGANIQYSIFSHSVPGADITATIVDENKKPKDMTFSTATNTDIALYDINIPVSVMYDIAVTNTFSVAPYAGIRLRAGLSGTQTSQLSLKGASATESQAVAATNPALFEEVSSSVYDNDFKRFNIGWQAGVNLYYDCYTLGFSYGTYLNKITDETTLKQGSITLGYRF